MKSYRFDLPADHFQLYLQDWDARPDTAALWTTQAGAQHIALAEGLIAVSMERYGGIAEVAVEIRDSPPEYSADGWDHIVHATISASSGLLMLYSPELNYQGEYRIPVEPGIYEVLIFYGDIDGFDDDLDESGGDHYLFVMWPGKALKTSVIKQYTRQTPPTEASKP